MSKGFLTLKDIDFNGKTVFLRTEFNVALDDKLQVVDDSRLLASMPTIEYILKNNAKLVICSHIGRPWGQKDESKSLKHLIKPLERCIGRSLAFSDSSIGPSRLAKQRALKNGEVLLLENVRYHMEENKNDEQFSMALAEGIDVYVNDAFGNCHRSHASMVGVPRFVSEKAAGLLVQNEVEILTSFLENVEHPSLAIVGGAKISGKDGKINVIRNLCEKVDEVFIIGKIANSFLLSSGVDVGMSLDADNRQIDAPGSGKESDSELCRAALAFAKERGVTITLPVDSLCLFEGNAQPSVVEFDKASPLRNYRALDIGPKTCAQLENIISKARSIIWNGPAGFYEDARFRQGTIAVAQSITKSGALALVGGGDTLAALKEVNQSSSNRVHACTGGGAMLTLLMGKPLPALEALK